MLRKRSKDALIQSCQGLTPVLTIAVHPCDEPSLSGALSSAAAHLITPVLIGPETRIRSLATSLGLDLTGLRLVNVPHSYAAAERAVELVRAGEGNALMKGSLHTDELMTEVVRKDTGLRTARQTRAAGQLRRCRALYPCSERNYRRGFVRRVMLMQTEADTSSSTRALYIAYQAPICGFIDEMASPWLRPHHR
jgi:hypothetical protein